MSQDRLDQTCRLQLGTRDAVHVPIVSAQVSPELDWKIKLVPGSYVKFVDDNFTKFVPCDKNEAHGVINPFIDEVGRYENVVVMLTPGITTPVRHNFDINTKQKEIEREILEIELKEIKEGDPQCAGCWEIRNNRIIRN